MRSRAGPATTRLQSSDLSEPTQARAPFAPYVEETSENEQAPAATTSTGWSSAGGREDNEGPAARLRWHHPYVLGGLGLAAGSMLVYVAVLLGSVPATLFFASIAVSALNATCTTQMFYVLAVVGLIRPTTTISQNCSPALVMLLSGGAMIAHRADHLAGRRTLAALAAGPIGKQEQPSEAASASDSDESSSSVVPAPVTWFASQRAQDTVGEDCAY